MMDVITDSNGNTPSMWRTYVPDETTGSNSSEETWWVGGGDDGDTDTEIHFKPWRHALMPNVQFHEPEQPPRPIHRVRFKGRVCALSSRYRVLVN